MTTTDNLDLLLGDLHAKAPDFSFFAVGSRHLFNAPDVTIYEIRCNSKSTSRVLYVRASDFRLSEHFNAYAPTVVSRILKWLPEGNDRDILDCSSS